MTHPSAKIKPFFVSALYLYYIVGFFLLGIWIGRLHFFPSFFSPSVFQRKSSDVFFYFNVFSHDYAKILLSFFVAFFLCLLLFIVSYLLSFSTQKEYEKSSEYECGFDPFDNATRQPFEVHFYIVGILFLIFDVEVALLFPWSVGLNLAGNTGFWTATTFLIIITLGFIYEWKRGALSWPHPTLNLTPEVTK